MSHRTLSRGRDGRIESLEPRRLLAVAGTLDTSFSLDGKLTVDIGFDRPAGAYTIDAADVAVQSDGKTVVAGTFRPADNNDEDQRDFAVMRFNLDGTLDQTFGGGSIGTPNGMVFAHLGKREASEEQVTSLAIAPDGKIVVAGRTRVERNFTSDTDDFAVMRLLPNGTLDNTFDGDGRRTIQFAEDDTAIANDVAVRSDGTVILVGYTWDTVDFDLFPPYDFDDMDFAVAILNADGSLQSQGRRVFGFAGDEIHDTAHAVTIGPGGTIIVVGQSDAQTGSFAVARLLPNGDFDTSFGSGGRLLTPLPGRTQAKALDVLAQGDKIVVVGESLTGVTRRSEMVRYLVNGQIDPLFGTGGVFVVETPGLNAANAIIRSADGGLVVGGEGSGGFVIAGYTADGVLNTAFGNAGLVTTPFNETTPVLSGLARGPGRRFVATGGPLSPTARYLDTGANFVYAQPLFDATAGETAPNPASFFVFVQERLPFDKRVYFSIGGTATFNPFFGSDYQISGMTVPTSPDKGGDMRPYVIIPKDQTFKQVTIVPIDDRLVEGTERAVFSIVPDPAYEIGVPSGATLAILDNDSTISRTVGTFTATTPDKHVAAGEEIQTTVTWTVPTGGWRQLSSIQLLLRDLKDDSTQVLLRFDEGSDSFVLENSPGAAYGPVSLLLDKCSFSAAGPTAPTVTVTFTWRFTDPAAKHRFTLDVAATNDIGERDGFFQITKLHVHKKLKEDPLALLL